MHHALQKGTAQKKKNQEDQLNGDSKVRLKRNAGKLVCSFVPAKRRLFYI